MNAIIARPAAGASPATSRRKASPKAHSAATPPSDGQEGVRDAVCNALQQASVLLSFLIEADNLHIALGATAEMFISVDSMLSTAAYPEKGSKRELTQADVTGLSSALAAAMEALEAAPGPYEGTALLAATLATQAHVQLTRIANALSCVPADLATLKALGTYEGSRPCRQQPRPAISCRGKTHRHSADDVQRVFEKLTAQCEALRDFSMDIRGRLLGNSEGASEACNDLTLIHHTAAFMGSICEEMGSGIGGFIGGPASWATGDGIEPIGGAA